MDPYNSSLTTSSSPINYPPTFNILTWNCNGFFTPLPDLQLLIEEYNPKIIALQETHLQLTKSVSLRNYTIYNCPQISNTKTEGGVLLAIDNAIYSEEINLSTNLQASAARILAPTPLTVCSIYIPPNTKLTTDDLSELISLLPRPFLLDGDFNDHSPSWGGHHINQHGKIVEECIDKYNLTILNSTPTHFNSIYHSWSTVDLILSSASLADIALPHTHHNLAGSNHIPIITILNAFAISPTHYIPK